jgi:chromate transporter
VSLAEAARVWARIGMLGFGGPAGQIALMHRELVERRRWISEERFLHALNYCMLLPGPEAQQLATYIGWLLHRARGGLVAGVLFVLPGVVAILALSLLYVGFRHAPPIEALFFGLKAAVLAIVVEAVVRLGRRALASALLAGVAALAFVAIFLFGVPFPLVVAGAAAVGLLGGSRFSVRAADVSKRASAETLVDVLERRGELAHTRPSRARAARVLVASAIAWAAPVGLVALLCPGSVLLDEALFFSQAALVTFGGAYAVLAYVAQQAVERYAWLSAGEMVDGLGLAETTPGPLIMVVQFVAFVGAHRSPGPLAPLAAGVLGSLLTTWVTFVPCFLWIFLGAPYIERLRASVPLRAALSAITAAVVGVVLNLSVWFSLHTLFARVHAKHFGPVRLLVPEWATLSLPSLVLGAAALVAMLRFKVPMIWTLAASAALGMTWRLAGG